MDQLETPSLVFRRNLAKIQLKLLVPRKAKATCDNGSVRSGLHLSRDQHPEVDQMAATPAVTKNPAC